MQILLPICAPGHARLKGLRTGPQCPNGSVFSILSSEYFLRFPDLLFKISGRGIRGTSRDTASYKTRAARGSKKHKPPILDSNTPMVWNLKVDLLLGSAQGSRKEAAEDSLRGLWPVKGC